MQVGTNLSAISAQRSYQRSTAFAETSVQRLSTGQRINSARDDAAGLAVTERLTARVNGMDRARQNANDAISLLQVAEGAVSTVSQNFQRIRELAVQAGNSTNSSTDRQALLGEVNALMKSNYDILSQTSYNHIPLLDGSFQRAFQTGSDAGQSIGLTIAAILPDGMNGQGTMQVPVMQVNAQGTAITGPLRAGDLVINGTTVGAAVAGTLSGQSDDSAYAVAAAINAASPTDVTATASSTVSANVAGAVSIAGGALVINGVGIGPIAGANATQSAAAAAAAISGVAGATGVSASASGGTLTLTAADGRNIGISGAGSGALGLGNLVVRGAVTLTNTAAANADKVLIGGNRPGVAGFNAGIIRPTDTGNTITVFGGASVRDAPIDLSDATKAAAALGYVDAKLDLISTVRASLGATQNRLAAERDNLSISSLNLSSARSRIRDTDYASETMELTRNQILQQAGSAMVAQANASQGQILALLRQ